MKKERKLPWCSLVVLGLIISACLLAGVLAPREPAALDSSAINQAPGAGHLLGTDSMGRDLLSMLLYGGRASIYIGASQRNGFNGYGSGLRHSQRPLPGMAQRFYDAVFRTADEYSLYPAGDFSAGDVGTGDCHFSGGNYRPHQLDEYFKDSQKRGAADLRKRLRPCRPGLWRAVFGISWGNICCPVSCLLSCLW